MRQLIMSLAAVLLVTACSGGDDLQAYVAQVKARPPAPIEPLPVIRPFEPMKYVSSSERNPFSQPHPELLQRDAVTKKPTCEVTLPVHEKEYLEQFSLDNLSMRGTMGSGKSLWALIHTQVGEVHRVSVGQYMGLNQGRIESITPDEVELLEYVPDGKGCWVTRKTQLKLTVAN